MESTVPTFVSIPGRRVEVKPQAPAVIQGDGVDGEADKDNNRHNNASTSTTSSSSTSTTIKAGGNTTTTEAVKPTTTTSAPIPG
jgi:hypothetical protein